MLPGMMDDESGAPEAPVWVQFKDNTTSVSICGRQAIQPGLGQKRPAGLAPAIKAQASISLLGL